MAVEMGAPKRELYQEVNRLAEAVDSGGGGGSDINVVQTTGQSTTDVMSQKAITDLLEDANNTFARKDGKYVDMVVGKAIMAQVDDKGEYIPDKYAKKTELPTIAQGTGNSTTSVMSQKATTDALATKVATTELVTHNTSESAHADIRTAISNCLPKNGPDLVVGQTLSAIISGKSYLDCAITATVSSGTYYFYNCTGAITINGSTVKLYLTNCPNLTVEEKYMGAIIRDGVTLLYDKDSSYNSLNWGYPSGIKVASNSINRDFSNYRSVIVSAHLTNDCTGMITVGKFGTLFSCTGSGDYVGRMPFEVLSNSLRVVGAREWESTIGNPANIIDYDASANYYINKLWGVLK